MTHLSFSVIHFLYRSLWSWAPVLQAIALLADDQEDSNSLPPGAGGDLVRPDPSVEAQLLAVLCEVSLTLPMTSTGLCSVVAKRLDNKPVSHDVLTNLLLKFATQQLIT